MLLIHFSDLLTGREATMRYVAAWLGIEVPELGWPALSEVSSFDSMRSAAATTVPDSLGVLKDPQAFFRAGSSGEGAELCPGDLLNRYDERMAELATPDVRSWINRM